MESDSANRAESEKVVLLTSFERDVTNTLSDSELIKLSLISDRSVIAPGQVAETLTDGVPSQIFVNGKFVSIEESLLNGWNEIPPALLGNKSINLPYDKPAGSLSKRRIDSTRSVGFPDRSYQQKTDPSSICSSMPRWGTPPNARPRARVRTRVESTDVQFSIPITELDFSIPGTGDITDPAICGKTSKVVACSAESLHYKKRHKKNCHKTGCPICFGGAIYRAAKTASSKARGFEIDAIAKSIHTDSYSELIFNHFVLSAPRGLIDPDTPYDRIKQMGRNIAEKAGIWGGFMAFHPWRLKKKIVKKLAKLYSDGLTLDEEGREKRYWELARSDALQLESWRKYIIWSPHFHAGGFGRLPDQNTDKEKADVKKLYKGWVVVWLRHVSTECVFDGQRVKNPIAELAYYIFSHAGLQKGKKIPIWLGELSQNRIYLDRSEPQEYSVTCPKCDSVVIDGDETEIGEFIPRINSSTGEHIPHVIKYKERVYVIGRCKKGDWRTGWREQCEAARLERLSWGIT